ncbi:deleted in malignant brain tumors 1 protein-like [Stegostoma tigrinum]|uniref:deleted in malignant brain tumors 1 protein-like n=1 Tax=Stegostoma tigrinum TaxID=3053191 RepID=UPI00287097FA|nr:deleted in malignant brain tumors 1 protein-like [Stegostoma tigrinum]
MCFCLTEHLQLRLSDGGSTCAGRVEIYYNGTWGSVCDDSWDMVDAQVVCRQLGCGDALDMTLPSYCGPGSGPVWLKDVKCSGNESFLWECPSARFGEQDDCSHKEDVRIICSEHKAMRLVNGKHRCEGRVEVFYNGTWGTVCSDKMNSVNGNIICKHLHCGAFQYIEDDINSFGAGTGQIWLDEIECQSHESKLWQCQSDLWGQHNCNHKEDAGVVCSEIDERMEQPLSSNSCIQNSDSQHTLRLVGGNSNCSGRVEIMCNEHWGTLCGDSWDMTDANVVCSQQSCGFAVSAQRVPAVSQGIYEEIENIPVSTTAVQKQGTGMDFLVRSESLLEKCGFHSSSIISELIEYVYMLNHFPRVKEDITLNESQSVFGERNSASIDSLNRIDYYTNHNVSENNPESPNPEVKSNSIPGPICRDYDDIMTEEDESQAGHSQLDSDPDENLTLTNADIGLHSVALLSAMRTNPSASVFPHRTFALDQSSGGFNLTLRREKSGSGKPPLRLDGSQSKLYCVPQHIDIVFGLCQSEMRSRGQLLALEDQQFSDRPNSIFDQTGSPPAVDNLFVPRCSGEQTGQHRILYHGAA